MKYSIILSALLFSMNISASSASSDETLPEGTPESNGTTAVCDYQGLGPAGTNRNVIVRDCYFEIDNNLLKPEEKGFFASIISLHTSNTSPIMIDVRVGRKNDGSSSTFDLELLPVDHVFFTDRQTFISRCRTTTNRGAPYNNFNLANKVCLVGADSLKYVFVSIFHQSMKKTLVGVARYDAATSTFSNVDFDQLVSN